MIKFIVARHGMTEPNTRNECLGLRDEPLNDEGITQAKRLAETIRDIKADSVFTSPLKRAVDTAMCYTAALGGVPAEIEPLLTERDWGDWEGKSLAQLAEEFPDEYNKFCGDMLNYTVPGGESSAAVQERVNALLKRITAEHNGETVCLFTHLGTARHIISRLLGLSPEESWRFFIDTASYAVITYDNNTHKGVLTKLN